MKSKLDYSTEYKQPSKQISGKDRYSVIGEVGSGTFGTVFKAKDKKSLETVAIKKVFQDKKYKNR